MRDDQALQRALLIVIRETRKAWHRNGDKKDPRRETANFWLDKNEEEAREVREAWLSGDKQRFFEEVGDEGNSLVGLILQGGYDEAHAATDHAGKAKEEADVGASGLKNWTTFYAGACLPDSLDREFEKATKLRELGLLTEWRCEWAVEGALMSTMVVDTGFMKDAEEQ